MNLFITTATSNVSMVRLICMTILILSGINFSISASKEKAQGRTLDAIYYLIISMTMFILSGRYII